MDLVILTRPKPESIAMQKVLAERGIKVYIEPLLSIQYLKPHLLNINNFNIVIATSHHAIVFLGKYYKNFSGLIITVGDSTAKVAQENGFNNVKSVSGNVNQLILYILQNFLPNKDSFLYIRGQNISCNLKKILKSHGFLVKDYIVYKAIYKTWLSKGCQNLLKTSKIKKILFYSKNTAKTFSYLIRKYNLSPQLRHIIAYVLSDNIAKSISNYPWNQIIITKKPLISINL